MQEVISIDYWSKKIWTAVWDTLTQIAFPKETFFSKEKLFEFIKKNNFTIILLWNPKMDEKFFSEQKNTCENFFEELKKNFPDKKIFFQDERFSSKIAQQKMKNMWLNQKKWKNFEDCIAAQILLEDFFETNKLDF